MKGWNDFIEVKNILDEFTKDHFIHSGSALGIYRDNQVIVRGSHSFGFGLFGLRYLKQIRDRLIEKGFTINPRFEWGVKGQFSPMTSMIEFKREEAGFIYFFIKDPECYRAYLDPEHPWLSIPHEFDKFQKHTINGVEINLLAPVEDYLTWVFGPDWREPRDHKSYPPAQGKLKP